MIWRKSRRTVLIDINQIYVVIYDENKLWLRTGLLSEWESMNCRCRARFERIGGFTHTIKTLRWGFLLNPRIFEEKGIDRWRKHPIKFSLYRLKYDRNPKILEIETISCIFVGFDYVPAGLTCSVRTQSLPRTHKSPRETRAKGIRVFRFRDILLCRYSDVCLVIS